MFDEQNALLTLSFLANGKLQVVYNKAVDEELTKEQGVPVEVISRGMGHTSEKTTQIYLKDIEEQAVDKVNRQLISLIEDCPHDPPHDENRQTSGRYQIPAGKRVVSLHQGDTVEAIL